MMANDASLLRVLGRFGLPVTNALEQVQDFTPGGERSVMLPLEAIDGAEKLKLLVGVDVAIRCCGVSPHPGMVFHGQCSSLVFNPFFY